MEEVRLENFHRWNEVLKQFNRKSVYYTNEYVRSLLLESDDRASLLYFKGEKSEVCFPVIISDIAKFPAFTNLIEKGKYYDMETPYGYGGPLCDEMNQTDFRNFRKEIDAWAVENNIVSLFTRFNPLSKNYSDAEVFYDEIRYLHHTVYIDIHNENVIWENMDPKCRNMIRKAEKSGVYVEVDENMDDVDAFIKLYEGVMDIRNAADMYYFPKEYYEYLRDNFSDHIIMVKAKYEGNIIGASLFLYDNEEMHYHLSGSDSNYKNLACTNLILYEAAKWGTQRGLKKFHLGGGMSEEDTLYKFKKKFNRKGELDFCIGKQIFDEKNYSELLDIRCEHDESFQRNNSRMIQYRY